jgi:biopolymer transport protein ExbD
MDLDQGALAESEPLVARKPLVEDAHFDITAMVDLVFMMNIFFLVTWVGAALAELDLPTARHCVAADPEACVIVSMVVGASPQSPLVYLGDARSSAQPIDSPDMDDLLRAAVEKGSREGRNTLLIKAEKRIRLQDIVRVAGATTAVEGTKLNLAVIEKE